MTVISAELETRDHVQVEDIRQVGHYTPVMRLNCQAFLALNTDRRPRGH